jgi:hypothetical protein
VTVGVGRRCTALGSIRSPDEPRWFGPPFVPSVARGVGKRDTVVRISGPPVPCVPGPLVSEVFGVGNSGDETAVAAMGCADVSSAQHNPPEAIPAGGQAIRGSGKFSSGNDGRNVFQQHISGSKVANGTVDFRPECTFVTSSLSFTGGGPGLTRPAGGKHLDGLNLVPVHGGDVA